MELNQLRYFQVVARHQHMTRAANELHVSQSSLSKTIAALEADVGSKLFDRIGGRIVLNTVGQQFLTRVDQSLLNLDDAVEEANQADSGQVSFAVGNSALCAEYMYQFIRKNPNIHLRHYPMPYRRMLEALEKGEIDFAITYDALISDVVSWTPIGEEQVLLLVHEDHPLAAERAVSLSDFRNEKFIFNNSDFSISETGDSFCRSAGFVPHILFEGDEPKTSLKLVEEGLGVMFMSEYEYHWHTTPQNPSSPFSGVKAIQIKTPRCQRKIGVSRMENRYVSPSTMLFLAGLEQYFRS